jgi:hypothetical protein
VLMEERLAGSSFSRLVLPPEIKSRVLFQSKRVWTFLAKLRSGNMELPERGGELYHSKE